MASFGQFSLINFVPFISIFLFFFMNIEIIFQLLALAVVLAAGPLIIVLLASQEGNL